MKTKKIEQKNNNRKKQKVAYVLKALKIRFWLSRVIVYFPNRIAWMQKINNKGFFYGKSGIEIGGPSRQFRYIYDNCKKCDGVNFSNSTLWGDNRDIYTYRGKKLGKLFIDVANNL